ncbi:protein DOWNY MILDEW RESISTANCE 6-like isoform X1 [Vicia villosa]|uniref:protein DOWNY MILDEW RESISTANCE 6-like isoform X1 n=1 Tax=Vicia villosa TaxID=3911 RepID=UPI00273BD88E|nr:protein DOWNY MILDEW RESISTANCE 6-like isoform X1 [Vicia villosa]
MEKLVSNWSNIQSVPENYIFPPETRPGEDLKIPFSHSIPIIDLNEAQNGDRANTIQKIIKAAKEFGFFHVINHGISLNEMNETMSVFKEVFQMPNEYKHSLYLDDDLKTCKIFTSSLRYETEKVHLWRDSLRHPSHPLEQWQHLWPENPTTYRECVGNFSIKIKDLGSRILDLISEGLGLKCGYFDNDLTGSMIISVNHYPPCPKPSLTLGLTKHKDPYLITILMQDDVSGLQVLKDGKWITVKPLPHAFVINIGHLLEIISKGKLISAEHRAVTNSSHTRTSAAFFIAPSDDCLIEPAQETGDENDYPILKSFKYKEFLKEFFNSHHMVTQTCS